MLAQSIRFTKMHGLGNDFAVFDAINQPLDFNEQLVRQLADRHEGIGFDQLLLVEPHAGDDADFRYRIFNADGSEVEHCGNGARCFARFVYEQGLTQKTRIPVMTESGRIVLELTADGQVTVNMGIPRLEPAEIPFIFQARQMLYTVDLGQDAVQFAAVSMGNPHAVLQVADTQAAPVESLGASLESHPLFPKRVNVGFMQVINPQQIRLRVFERGTGETRACGTGACAAVVAGRLQGLLAEQVQVDLPGGRLQIAWQGEGQPVYMTGPATTVYTGTVTV
ncbi:diaminopimelate epimerase [Thiothrix eikelboomii]|uniref:Diaminopimelate epimerase n=1 Tax=Thiothrix eikelboomii TaxID=92487 RepID=A0A1T4VUX5_9GAMM|nr:diaminopimelate epimerase [Thiothrix eikelboomii]SKA68804.1 diaminopimelate epimerase [Thiothrix eikelboomii]